MLNKQVTMPPNTIAAKLETDTHIFFPHDEEKKNAVNCFLGVPMQPHTKIVETVAQSGHHQMNARTKSKIQLFVWL